MTSTLLLQLTAHPRLCLPSSPGKGGDSVTGGILLPRCMSRSPLTYVSSTELGITRDEKG